MMSYEYTARAKYTCMGSEITAVPTFYRHTKYAPQKGDEMI